MSLLEPSEEEKAEAAKFLPPTPEPEKDAPPSVDPEETPTEESTKSTPEPEGQGGESDAEDDAQPSGIEKRIAQLTKQRRDAERELAVLKARDDKREREFQELKEQIAAVTATPEPQLSEDASPEEIRAYYEARTQREMDRKLNEMQQVVAAAQVNTLVAVQEMKHDGADGNPSFSDLRTEYEQLITHDPRYEHTRNQIQSSTNPPAKFYELALEFWRQDHAGDIQEEENRMRERDVTRVATGAGGTQSRPNGRTKLTEEERSTLKKVFGNQINPDGVEKLRSDPNYQRKLRK